MVCLEMAKSGSIVKKNKIFRIVFSRPSELKMGLAYGFKFNRKLLPKEAVDAMDRIAMLASRVASGTH